MKKDHPILFSTPMIQAILEGRKTQTRRVMKPQPEIDLQWAGGMKWQTKKHTTSIEAINSAWYDDVCPYGNIGDVLWVRETMIKNDGYTYWPVADGYKKNTPLDKTVPSIYMPKNACRLFLEITSVRVERLHDISESDAKAEGVLLHKSGKHWLNYVDEKHRITQFIYNCDSAKESFKTLWTLINGFRDEPYAWFKNPWVWVVEFKQIKQAA